MENDKINKDANRNGTDNTSIRPDPETLHTTDPQENMEGPISSLMHNTGKEFETDKTKREAEEEKEKNM